MAFDFEKAIADTTKALKSEAFCGVVLGQSGAGKSSVAGTFGVPTLYLAFSGEDHGPRAAKMQGGSDITPIYVDYEGGKQLSPDQAWARLNDILDAKAVITGKYKALVIDGATELSALIKQTSIVRNGAVASNGKPDGFKETAMVIDLMKSINDKAKAYVRENGIHYLITCLLDVQAVDEMGSITSAKPRLPSYGVAEELVRQFNDILVVGRMTNGEVVKHKFQFLTEISRQSKDFKTGAIKKILNFHPRLTGVKELPEFCDASMKAILALKAAK